MLLSLQPLNEISLQLPLPEMFSDISCVGLTHLHVDEWLLASVVEQRVLVAYVKPAPVLDVDVLLRLPA